ncbi:cysteine--tRNA ligase [Psychromicrobium lacuslunae]|uniref:cysteine--tRNA ligase n=1 Tax=Psychromicrobium lacuslunae TaxID=1618207 RepID=UPI0005D3CB0D|nr:cysteine--tRNA ligase [Psychromicrobium lacuslunae]
MTLRFYDSATAEVRDFQPLIPGQASLYYCGATVQSEPHIGHLRSALVFDQLTRWLQFRGLRTTVVRNVTDIDDKILAKAAEAGEEWWARAYRYEREFNAAYDALGISRPDYEPRATGHIPEMHQLIQDLIDRGHAYPATDNSGDVYFDVRSWGKYGSLTRQNIDDMQAATDADPRGKKDPRDFALWKGRKEDEPATASWPSPWGAGRPGWHLECSAMVGKYLGDAFDIHGGGLDLRFPHHENEMAQSQAAGKDFANFWMHNGLVSYQGEKMSKSIGNVIGPNELFAQASARVVRYYLGQAHYRSVLDYSPESLEEAGAAMRRIDGFMGKAALRVTEMDMQDVFMPSSTQANIGWFAYAPLGYLPESFGEAMDDDLNIPKALAVLHEAVRAGNAALASNDTDELKKHFFAVLSMTSALGLDALPSERTSSALADRALNILINTRLAERTAARAAKDWARSDEIRDELAEAGIKIEDSADGPSWTLSTDSGSPGSKATERKNS